MPHILLNNYAFEIKNTRHKFLLNIINKRQLMAKHNLKSNLHIIFDKSEKYFKNPHLTGKCI